MPTSFKTAIVTGGAKRIGRAIVLDLAASGFAVAIHCNGSRDEAEALADEIKARDGQAAVVQGDLTDAGVLATLVGSAAAMLGPIGLLVNNASLFVNDEIDDFSWDVWDRHFAIHAKAPVMLARTFAAQLPRDSEGLVVNIIDQRVWKPTPRYFSYGLSKSVMLAATTTMAQALAPRIRVNAIGPGPALPNTRQSEADFAAQVEKVPLGHGPGLDEFGMTIRYLWEARSVTGQMIAVDGGQHLAWQTPDVTGVVE